MRVPTVLCSQLSGTEGDNRGPQNSRSEHVMPLGKDLQNVFPPVSSSNAEAPFSWTRSTPFTWPLLSAACLVHLFPFVCTRNLKPQVDVK